MATTKKKQVVNENKQEENKIICACCGKEKLERYYYKSNSVVYKHFERMPVCKDCVLEIYDNMLKESNDAKSSVYRMCQLLDMPYLEVVFVPALTESHSRGMNVFQAYIKNINSLKQYQGYTFENGDSLEDETIKEDVDNDKVSITNRDKQNRDDVLRLLGYDPFEGESKQDKKYLYNRLIDFLDDSTLEDSFKLLTVIEIVKSYNQIDKINTSLALMTQDSQGMIKNSGGVKSLIDSKKNILATVLNMAKDNGISVNHNNNKSKGAGTLSGIIKKLNEIGLDEIQTNLFDIETASGMNQVDEISHSNILKQLQLDENDYTDMIAQQRDMIRNMDKKLEILEEENRQLKIKTQKK